MRNKIIYLNGKFLPANKAKISVFDRGFLFGDGVYELIHVTAGKPFQIQKHLIRMQNSLTSLAITAKIDFEKLAKNLNLLIKYNKLSKQDCVIYIEVTRGEAKERNYYIQDTLKLTIFAYAQCNKGLPTVSSINRGLSAITLDDIRWQYCNIKSISLIANVLMYDKVKRAKAAEGILIRNKLAIEGISSNLFIVKNGKIITPPLDKHKLSGTTRALILKLAKNNHTPIFCKNILAKSLNKVQEIWITSSNRGIFPIVKLNGKKIGTGKPGPMWQKLNQLYLAYKKS
jgi:D-alanine transaminase